MQWAQWRPAVKRHVPMALLAVAVATLALVAANVRLVVPVGVGMLLAFLFWRISCGLKVSVFVLVIALLWLAACGPAEFGWSIKYRVTATLVNNNTQWDIVDEITVPADRVVQVMEDDDTWLYSRVDPPTKEEFRRKLEADFRALERILVKEGWTFTRMLDGEKAVFTRHRGPEPAQVRMFPLVSRQTLAIPDIELVSAGSPSASVSPSSSAPRSRRVVFTPAADSEILIEAPRNVVEATDPPSEAKTVPGGEQRRIVSGESAVELSLLSPVSRHEPVRSIAHVSLAQGTGWVLAFLWTLVLSMAQDGTKQGLMRLFGRSPAPDSQPTAPPAKPAPRRKKKRRE